MKGGGSGTLRDSSEHDRDGAALEEPDGPAPTAGGAPGAARGSAAETEPDGQLFPPGPLARVKLVPGSLRLPPDVTRGFRARALDADGRPAHGPLAFTWHLEGAGELVPEDDGARYTAPSSPAFAALVVHVHSGALHAEARAEI